MVEGAKDVGKGLGLNTRFSAANESKRFPLERSKYWRLASSGVVTKLKPKGILSDGLGWGCYSSRKRRMEMITYDTPMQSRSHNLPQTNFHASDRPTKSTLTLLRFLFEPTSVGFRLSLILNDQTTITRVLLCKKIVCRRWYYSYRVIRSVS